MSTPMIRVGSAVLAVGLVLALAPAASADTILLMIVGGAPNTKEVLVIDRLENTLGHTVDTRQGSLSLPANYAVTYDLMVSSKDITEGELDKYRGFAVPVIHSQYLAYDNWNWQAVPGDDDGGETDLIIFPAAEGHPMAAGLSGTVTVYAPADELSHGWIGDLGPEATLIAKTDSPAGDRIALFVYDQGDALPGTNPGAPNIAPAVQIGFFYDDEAENLTADGWKLFDASVNYALTSVIPEPNSLVLAALGLLGLLGWGPRRRRT